MSNNASFDPSLSWLSYSETNIINYEEDLLCGVLFTNASNKVLFTLTYNLHKIKRYQCKNPTLRIYSFSGEDDRTTKGEKGLRDTMKTLIRAGYVDLKYKTYHHMKHEILMEDDHKMVIDDILKFFAE
jgi:alpha-beta hydrolase superfamily lysophospholipase